MEEDRVHRAAGFVRAPLGLSKSKRISSSIAHGKVISSTWLVTKAAIHTPHDCTTYHGSVACVQAKLMTDARTPSFKGVIQRIATDRQEYAPHAHAERERAGGDALECPSLL